MLLLGSGPGYLVVKRNNDLPMLNLSVGCFVGIGSQFNEISYFSVKEKRKKGWKKKVKSHIIHG